MPKNTVCLNCQRTLDPESRQINFCSRTCAREHRRKVGTGKSKCLHCGKAIEFRTYKPRKYCSADCAGRHTAYQRNKQIDVTCNQCGVIFKTPPSQPRKFCSRDCYEQNRSQSMDGIPSERTCEQCGNLFAVTTSKKNQRFCSHACYGQSMENKDTRICEQCSQPFQCKPCDKVRFCCVQCAWESFKVEGSHSGYGSDWPHIRDAIRERDNYTCQYCGIGEDGRAHDVHHLTPLRDFGDDLESAHDPLNLITLCRSCHSLAESRKIHVQITTQD